MSIDKNRFKRGARYSRAASQQRVPGRGRAAPSRQIQVPLSPTPTGQPDQPATQPAAQAGRPVWDTEASLELDENDTTDSRLEWWDEDQPESDEAIMAAFGAGIRQQTDKLPRISFKPLQRTLRAVWEHIGWQKSLVALFVLVLVAVPFVYRWGPKSHHLAGTADGAASSLRVSNASASTNHQLANASSALSGNAASHETVKNSYQPSPTLNFTPLVPAQEPQLAQLGSKAYDNAHGAYTFDDTYLGEPVRVSEELIPPGFNATTSVKDATDSVMRAAQPFAAPSGTGYVGSSTTTGAQVVVAAQKGILIFVQTQYQHPGYAWKLYLNSLQ